MSWASPTHSNMRILRMLSIERGVELQACMLSCTAAHYAKLVHDVYTVHVVCTYTSTLTQCSLSSCQQNYTDGSCIPYSRYFSGSNIFVVKRRTTKFLPTKPYRIAPGYGLYTATAKIFPRTGQKFTVHENFTPRKIPAIR